MAIHKEQKDQTLRRRRPPPKPLSPSVKSIRASLVEKHAPFHSIVPLLGVTDPTQDGNKSTAEWKLLSTGHDICRGRTGSTSLAVKGRFIARPKFVQKRNAKAQRTNTHIVDRKEDMGLVSCGIRSGPNSKRNLGLKLQKREANPRENRALRNKSGLGLVMKIHVE